MLFASAPDLLIGLFQCTSKQSNNPLEDFSFLHQFLFHFVMHQVNPSSPLPKQKEEKPSATSFKCVPLTECDEAQLSKLKAFPCDTGNFSFMALSPQCYNT